MGVGEKKMHIYNISSRNPTVNCFLRGPQFTLAMTYALHKNTKLYGGVAFVILVALKNWLTKLDIKIIRICQVKHEIN